MLEPRRPSTATRPIAGRFGLAILLAVLLLPELTVEAQTFTRTAREVELDQKIRGLPQLRNRLEVADRPIRVLAQVSRTTLEPSADMSEVLPMAGISSAQLATATQKATTTLRTQGIANVRAIKGLPLVTFEVKQSQLAELADSGQFAIIVEDKLSRPYLDSSGPVIGVLGLHALDGTGDGHMVAILDTGVDIDHLFLAGRVVEGACFSSNFAPHGATSLCPGGVDSATTVASGNHCTGVDGCDHGTHVAGIAAGRAAGGISITGVAPDANIMAVQVFSRFDDVAGGPNTCALSNTTSPCVLSYDSDQIRGLQQVSNRAAALNIIAANMSLGGGDFDSDCDADNAALKAIIDQLLAREAVTVIAAGNDSFRTSIGSPGCISTAVTIGSTTDSDAISSFSNLSDTVDLLAPGSSIESSVPGNGFDVFNGTSMATPQVTGAFAAIASCARPGTTVADIEAALETTGTTISDGRTGGSVTKNRVNVEDAGRAVGCNGPFVENCIEHSLTDLKVVSRGWWWWKKWWIVDGNRQLFFFDDNEAEAREALAVIQQFDFTSTCFIGRPDDASMQYLRTGTSVPGGSHGGNDCITFSRAGVQIESIGGGQWRLMDGTSRMLIFPNQTEAQQAVATINHHQLNRQCFVGRPDASFTYWLAE